METIILTATTRVPQPCVATIGFFDGVHLGHQYLIRQVVAQAHRLDMASVVVSFQRHPRQVVDPAWRPELLSTLDEKGRLLAATGVDRFVVLPFDKAMSELSGRDFMERVLVGQLHTEVLYMGYDNRFGRHRADGFDDFVGYGRELGVDVRRADAFDSGGVRVSSSVVRQCLGRGDVAQAARYLGRRYALTGRVAHGEHVGTGLGFPTANIVPDDPCKLVPPTGAYAVLATVAGDPVCHHAMMNIGTRPTFNGRRLTLEAHLFGVEADLYGQSVTVEFVARLRAERRFASAAELTDQLRRDAQQAETLLKQT